ncbi:MAG: FAD-binding protein [Actinobacteria bacterium]|nr:FAD-binding protein [Actinomycetota bacterium]
MADLVVAGAGMAGLAAAAEARSRGADVNLIEKGDRAGGSMLLSSGMVWRHATLDAFCEECPDGDRELQALIFERTESDIAWLESLGARVTERGTGNPRTAGVRFDTGSLTRSLVRAAGEPRLRRPLQELPAGTPVVLATGGFPAGRELLRRHVTAEADDLLLRATPWSAGDGLTLGLQAGAAASAGLDQIYGRNMPAPPARVEPADYVRLSQLYGRHASLANVHGETYEARTWSEIDVVQWTARQPRARAWFTVAEEALSERVRDRTVAEMVEAAERAGAPVERHGGSVTVETVAGVTSTLGGLRVDTSARAAPGVYAAGADAGGIATGGYSSGLAAALVLGRVAAAAALEDA